MEIGKSTLENVKSRLFNWVTDQTPDLRRLAGRPPGCSGIAASMLRLIPLPIRADLVHGQNPVKLITRFAVLVLLAEY